MEIRCFATLPLDQDEPIPCVQQFVRVLRTCVEDFERAGVDLNLIGVSKRAVTTIQEFQPARTKAVPFQRALEITEELTHLGLAKTKSLHFILTAEGFRWKGSTTGTSARLALLDGKSLQRKQRFTLYANLTFDVADANDPSIAKMVADIAARTGIRFEKEASFMRFKPQEPGRVTLEELFVTALTWLELVESVGQKVQKAISLDGIPHLMTTPEAHNFVFDPAKFGKSVPVNFSRLARKWLKDELPEFKRIERRLGR